jgi:hypothetical protein
VNLERAEINIALGIDVAMIAITGWNVIQKLLGADLDNSVTSQHVQASRLGIKDDFPHPISPTVSSKA